MDDDGATDAELLRRFVDARDDAAFGRLVRRHARMVRAAAGTVTGDRHLAEDAAQVAFLALACRPAAVRDNPAGWLVRVARRAALRMRRTASRPAVPDAAAEVRHGRTYEADEVAALRAELAALPDDYRRPLALCFFDGLTHAEAAERLGWPVGTVAGRVARAKARLRDRLAGRGVSPAVGLAAVPAQPSATLQLAVLVAATLVAVRLVPADRRDHVIRQGLSMFRRLAAWNERVSWVGLRHLKPARHEPMTLPTTLILAHVWCLPIPVVMPAYCFLLAGRAEAKSVVMAAVATLLTYTMTLCLFLISALAWNDRAAALRAKPAVPAAPAPEPAAG